MGSNNAEFKRYSRKGIIKNTEWVLYLFKGKNEMEKENRIENLLTYIKIKVKNYIKTIFNFISKKNVKDSYSDYDFERQNYNNYEKCRAEITMQIQRDRNLF